jgi:GDP-L-fucose synthase
MRSNELGFYNNSLELPGGLRFVDRLLDVQPVPEPETYAMLLAGLGLVGVVARRRRSLSQLRGDAEYVVWGTGAPPRELLYVDDLADACVFLMERGFDGPLINIGTGSDVTIRELAETVMQVVGCNGRIVYDNTKPDGTPTRMAARIRNACRNSRSRSQPSRSCPWSTEPNAQTFLKLAAHCAKIPRAIP